MKTNIILKSLIIIGFIGLLSGETIAQRRQQGATEARVHGGQQLRNLKEQLNLTDEQVAQLTSLNKSNKDAMLSLRNDETLDRQTKMELMQELRQEREEALKEILSPEQHTQFLTFQQQNQQNRQGTRSPKQGRAQNSRKLKQ
jgi:Spy/CpxP family protein refolding chaperone